MSNEPIENQTPRPPRVAFQGEPGAFSDEAARTYFGPEVRTLPCRDFDGVGRAVREGEVDYGLLPVENSLAGSVVPSFDVLRTDLAVVGEVILPIHHCLLAVPEAAPGAVTRVLSHPVALAQCKRFFARHPELEAVSYYDTAGAAKTVAADGDPATAAIASRLAGERYGLTVAEADIEDRADNQTRFLVVVDASRAAAASAPEGDTPYRTTLLAEAPNTPGSLVGLLLPFAERGINLS